MTNTSAKDRVFNIYKLKRYRNALKCLITAMSNKGLRRYRKVFMWGNPDNEDMSKIMRRINWVRDWIKNGYPKSRMPGRKWRKKNGK